MEKVLLLLNSHLPDSASIQFGSYIASLTCSKLTAVFVENLYTEYIPVPGFTGPAYIGVSQSPSKKQVRMDTEQAVRHFKDQCAKEGVEADVIIDIGEPIRQIAAESRYADLLLFNPRIKFYEEENFPSHVVTEILAKVECPVLLVPDEFEKPEEIVFCYDDSAASVYAMKQFTYLLPQLKHVTALLLEAREKNEDFDEAHQKMLSWLRTHYGTVRYHEVADEIKDPLLNYFFMQRKKFVVMGAYGRTMISRWFKKSTADAMIQTVDLPLFIAHH